MQLFFAKTVTGLLYRMPIKSTTFTIAAVLAGSLAMSGCNTGYNTAQTTATSVTKVGYGVPTQTAIITKADDIKTPRRQTTTRPAVSKTVTAPKPAKVASENYLGRAPYICTPSGFGSKTRCFNRS